MNCIILQREGTAPFRVQLHDLVLEHTAHRLRRMLATLDADSKLIVSGSSDKPVRQWNATQRESTNEPLQGHSDWVNSVAVSANGKLIASGSDNETIRLWDVTNGQAIGKPLRLREGWVNSVALSADSKLIVSGSSAGFDSSAEGRNIQTTFYDPLGHQKGGVNSVAMIMSGELVVSGSCEGKVRLWNVTNKQANGKPLR